MYRYMENYTQIYLVTNCYGDPNKVYIGKEKSNQSIGRENTHKIKFSNEINFCYIDKTQGWDKKDWKPLECFWIEQFRQWGFELQNKNKGGGGPDFFTSSQKELISKNKTGNLYKLKKLNLDLVVKLYETKSIQEICNELNITFSPLKKYLIKNELYIKNKNRKGKTQTQKENMSQIMMGKNNKKVYQFSIDGKLLNNYPSLTEASIIFNKPYMIEGISDCCKGKQKTAYGFIWSFKNKLNKIPQNLTHLRRPVLQYDLEGNFIREWDNLIELSKQYQTGNISACCWGKQKTSYGFMWRYKDKDIIYNIEPFVKEKYGSSKLKKIESNGTK